RSDGAHAGGADGRKEGNRPTRRAPLPPEGETYRGVSYVLYLLAVGENRGWVAGQRRHFLVAIVHTAIDLAQATVEALVLATSERRGASGRLLVGADLGG